MLLTSWRWIVQRGFRRDKTEIYVGHVSETMKRRTRLTMIYLFLFFRLDSDAKRSQDELNIEEVQFHVQLVCADDSHGWLYPRRARALPDRRHIEANGHRIGLWRSRLPAKWHVIRATPLADAVRGRFQLDDLPCIERQWHGVLRVELQRLGARLSAAGWAELHPRVHDSRSCARSRRRQVQSRADAEHLHAGVRRRDHPAGNRAELLATDCATNDNGGRRIGLQSPRDGHHVGHLPGEEACARHGHLQLGNLRRLRDRVPGRPVHH